MDVRLIDDAELALRMALDRMARAMLGAPDTVNATLGQMTLRPHQLAAVTRLLEIIASYRGALLADAVGLGKTYVALAVAREFGSALVICPAVLRPMWRRAMTATGIDAPIVTVEALSRGAELSGRPRLVIVDEAHHFRTPGTRRYEAVAHLARRARVLLMSATPLQNSRRDLASLLALFAGSSVRHWSDEAIARLIVRRDEHTAEENLPVVSGPHALSPGDDDDCLEAILALPAAVPAADEGVAHALSTISLLHLWSSSRAALVASVRKRLARATALRDAVAGGHLPTAAELSAWTFADDALQLAFPLFDSEPPIVDASRLRAQLDAFVAAAAALIDHCRASPDPDLARVKLIRALREQHRDDRVVAFSQYAHTISALGRLMRADSGIAIVTAAGARIASGPLEREEVLAQFAAGAADVHPVERIGLLLTTDLLSEGIDLRGASVVVHLDLPWNPARLEQRVGRTRRLGSTLKTIHVYTFSPPARAERMLQLRGRLTDKLRAARAVVGGEFNPFGDAVPGKSPVDAGEALRSHLVGWLGDSSGEPACTIAAAAASVTGWLAVVMLGGTPMMVGDFGDGIVSDPRRLLPIAVGIRSARTPNRARLEVALDRITSWLDAREASAGSGEQPLAKRAVLERLTQTVARTPRHRRASVLSSAQRSRAALAMTAGVGVERVMADLARSTVDDDAWLQSLETFSALHAADAPASPMHDRIVALVLLEQVSPAGDATPG